MQTKDMVESGSQIPADAQDEDDVTDLREFVDGDVGGSRLDDD